MATGSITIVCFLSVTMVTARVYSNFSNFDHNRFDGHRLVRLSASDKEHADDLQIIYQKHRAKLDTWSEFDDTTQSVHVRVEPHLMSTLYAETQEKGLGLKILIDDIQRLIDREQNDMMKQRMKRSSKANILGEYARYNEIIDWCSSLEQAHPDLVELLTIGKTYERRNMMVLKIGNPGMKDKPAIWLDAGIHAREWVAPAVAVYIVQRLLDRTNSESSRLIDLIDWYILPVANPDGYEFSHTHYRLWRLNTRPVTATCLGVDLNRNWDFMWDFGTYDDQPCSTTYRGNAAASEIEVQNIADFIMARKDSIVAFVSLHSYLQKFLTRWDYTNDTLPDDHQHLNDICQTVVQGIQSVHGTQYECGTAPRLLYAFSGGSADWARGVAGIKYPFLLELRDTGEFGFILPQDQIIPTGEETLEGLKVIANQVIDYEYSQRTEETTTELINEVANVNSLSSSGDRLLYRTSLLVICYYFYDLIHNSRLFL